LDVLGVIGIARVFTRSTHATRRLMQQAHFAL
jgi:hypothetical protein